MYSLACVSASCQIAWPLAAGRFPVGAECRSRSARTLSAPRPPGCTPFRDTATGRSGVCAPPRRCRSCARGCCRARKARLVPACKGTVRLVTQPAPGQIDRERADVAIGDARDPLLMLDVAVLAGRGHQPGERAELAAI